MKKLGNLKKSAALRKKTDLRPILHNDTRWSSKHAMLKRYKELKPFIDSMDAEKAQILHSSAEDIELEKPFHGSRNGRHNGNFCGSSFGKKKRKKAAFSVSNLRWIPCTSNVAERLFSSVSYVLTDFRAKILPVNLESHIFLMFNRCFWSECSIDEIVNNCDIN